MYLMRRTVVFLSVAAMVCCATLLYFIQNSHEERHRIVHTPGQFANKLDHARSITTPRCGESRSSRYVISLNYWEQLNMALQNLYSLTRLVLAWEGVTVKPFTSNSRLFGLPHLRADENWSTNMSSLSLSQLFDSQNLDSLSCIGGYRTMCDFDRFVEHANREVIVLHFIFAKEAHEFRVLAGTGGSQLKRELETNKTFECSKYLRIQTIKDDILYSLNRETESSGTAKFRIVKYWCINGTLQTTPTTIANQTELLSNNRSVLILNWRGVRSKSTPFTSAVGAHVVQRQFITFPGPQLPFRRRRLFFPSPRVLEMSSQFIDNTTRGEKFIAVHVRSEKLGQRGVRIPNYVTTCLDKAIQLKDNISKALGPKLAVMFVVDYGPFGSDSCKNCKGGRIVESLFQQYGIKPVRFPPSQYSAPSDSGFVSLVEMNALLKSQYLILVGGGAYQRQMTMQMKDQSSIQQTYTVCWDDKLQVKIVNKNRFIQ